MLGKSKIDGKTDFFLATVWPYLLLLYLSPFLGRERYQGTRDYVQEGKVARIMGQGARIRESENQLFLAVILAA